MRYKSACFVTLSILFVLVGALPLRAQWIYNGTPVCTESTNQNASYAVDVGSGNVIIAWSDDRNGPDDIFAQKIDANGVVQWAVNGVAVCTATSFQYSPQLIPDGAGGAIITWSDLRSGNYDVYAQRIDANGYAMWITDGVAISATSGTQFNPRIIDDGGGAIITWEDFRGADRDIYAQRVNSSGIVLWTANGKAVCSETGHQEGPRIARDEEGGAIISWDDDRGTDHDIYAQRIDGNGDADWTSNGVLLCGATSTQWETEIVADGSGGAIVIWKDYRSGTSYDIYTQRVDANGNALWTADGVPICQASDSENELRLVSDGAGGAIISWQDNRGADIDIYAQRINAVGTVQWDSDGMLICGATGHQQYPRICTDGSGGAILCWTDERTSSYKDLYAQRIDAGGTVQWTTDGVAFCTAPGTQFVPFLISFEGGAIATWTDVRGSDYDIYAQYIGPDGFWGLPEPEIDAVLDVPADEGGWVRIRVLSPEYDRPGVDPYPITGYNVWRRVDGGFSSSGPGDETFPRFPDMDEFIQILNNGENYLPMRISADQAAFLGLPPGDWESMGFHAAMQEAEYYFTAPTLTDSTESGIPWQTYAVTAHTPTPSVFFTSEADSGYSVDNLAPGMPGSLAGTPDYGPIGITLSWDPNTESDLYIYRIYRGSDPGFVPDETSLIGQSSDPEFFDEYDDWHVSYYKVSAVDRHGNESPFADLSGGDVAGGETPEVPGSYFLAQNVPNPFNPMTTISFGLREAGHVSLRIFDAAGRLVRVLVDEHRDAGTYEAIWDGRNGGSTEVASGVYFYRLDTVAFKETRKMVLLR
jgi:hypothetical protein